MKRNIVPRAGQAGFTLIEAMIAMFCLAYIISQMAALMVYASLNTNLSQRITRANQLAEEAVEKTRNTAYNKLQLANTDLGETGAEAASHTSTLGDGRFTRVRTVTPLPLSPVTPLASSSSADVVVTVSFTNAKGEPQVIRVASVVTRF